MFNPQILCNHCFQFLLCITVVPIENYKLEIHNQKHFQHTGYYNKSNLMKCSEEVLYVHCLNKLSVQFYASINVKSNCQNSAVINNNSPKRNRRPWLCKVLRYIWETKQLAADFFHWLTWLETTCGSKWFFVQVVACTIQCPPGHCSGAEFAPSFC